MHNSKRYKRIGITKHRLHELQYFCLQYRQWKYALTGTLTDSDRKYYLDNINLIDRTIEEVGDGISAYLLDAVTREDVTYQQLHMQGIPCGRKYFYEHRRRFFVALDARKRGTQETLDHDTMTVP